MEVNREAKTITISQNTGITVSLALLMALGGALITVTSYLSDIGNRLSNAENSLVANRDDINVLKNENTTTQVKFTEIQTQLKSIDSTLLDIKERLK